MFKRKTSEPRDTVEMMPQQRQVLLLWTLLLNWLLGTAASKSVDHSGIPYDNLAVYVFSSLQDSSSGDSLPPYPEGIELGLSCQAAARTTFWYERHSPDASPDPVKDKLESRSSDPVPGVLVSVFTIPHLKREDDGRELWCMMDSSSIKKVVKLDVVGAPSTPTIRNTKKGDGLELECSSQGVDHHLKLCWYRDAERLQCKSLKGNESPPTIVTTHVAGADLMEEKMAQLVCKARFKENRALDSLTKKAQDHFAAMLDRASVELEIVVRDTVCHDGEPPSVLSSTNTFTLPVPNSDLCRKVEIIEHKNTTPAPPTVLMATATSSSNARGKEKPGQNGGSLVTLTTLPLLLALALVFVL